MLAKAEFNQSLSGFCFTRRIHSGQQSRLNSLNLYKSQMYVSNPLGHDGTSLPLWHTLQTKFVCIEINIIIHSEIEPLPSRGGSSSPHFFSHYVKSDPSWKGLFLTFFSISNSAQSKIEQVYVNCAVDSPRTLGVHYCC